MVNEKLSEVPNSDGVSLPPTLGFQNGKETVESPPSYFITASPVPLGFFKQMLLQPFSSEPKPKRRHRCLV